MNTKYRYYFYKSKFDVINNAIYRIDEQNKIIEWKRINALRKLQWQTAGHTMAVVIRECEEISEQEAFLLLL